MTRDRDIKLTNSESGPYTGPRVAERPWEKAEVERGGPFERRRGGDRRAWESAEGDDRVERRRHWGRRKSDVLTTNARAALGERSQRFVRRFREPLIGLTLAGVAAPLINAGVSPGGEMEPADTGEAERDVAGAAAATAVADDRDLEGEVADVWAEADEDAVREQTVDGAAVRWSIDRPLAEKIYDYASRHDIEPEVAYGLVFTESSFRNEARSHVGARGLTQLMPRTAQWLDPTVSVRDLANPDKNLDLGFRYLRQLIDKYDGNLEYALTAYNRGPGTVDKILSRGGNPDNGYAGKVLAG